MITSIIYIKYCLNNPLCFNYPRLSHVYMGAEKYKTFITTLPGRTAAKAPNTPKEKKSRHNISIHYVPLKKPLSAFLLDKSVQQQLASKCTSADGFLCDIGDGNLFRESDFFKSRENTIQLLIFQDAFEVANPLGSARKRHKILGMYYTLANLPPQARSKVHSIQLLLLCYEATLQKVGQNAVMKALVSDLKDLEKNGINVDGTTYRWGVAAFLGDNLGSHGVGGFVESFSKSKYFCRFCEITREEFASKTMSVGIKRTPESYAADVRAVVEANLGSSKGVKFDSTFNALDSFHVTSGLPPAQHMTSLKVW